METSDLNLLKRNNKEKVSEQLLVDTWNDLQEYYFENTNQNSFISFKKNIKKIAEVKNEINVCECCEILLKYGQSDGFEILKSIGVDVDDFNKIRTEIFRRETKLRLIESRMNNSNKKESVKFYKILADIEMDLPHQINLETMTLERWVEVINKVREKRESANKTRENKSALSKKRR